MFEFLIHEKKVYNNIMRCIKLLFSRHPVINDEKEVQWLVTMDLDSEELSAEMTEITIKHVVYIDIYFTSNQVNGVCVKANS